MEDLLQMIFFLLAIPFIPFIYVEMKKRQIGSAFHSFEYGCDRCFKTPYYPHHFHSSPYPLFLHSLVAAMPRRA